MYEPGQSYSALQYLHPTVSVAGVVVMATYDGLGAVFGDRKKALACWNLLVAACKSLAEGARRLGPSRVCVSLEKPWLRRVGCASRP